MKNSLGNICMDSLSTGSRALLVVASLWSVGCGSDGGSSGVEEYPLEFPKQSSVPVEKQGSTHEITYNKGGAPVFWISAPTYDAVAELTLEGTPIYHQLPDGTAPHGLDFDSSGRLWAALEGTRQIARLDKNGALAEVFNLPTDCTGCTTRVEQDPHGLGFAADGKTVWYTGKTANTVGKVGPSGETSSFAVPTPGSFPIYIRLGPDGNMWFTELLGNKIGRVTDSGNITEFDIPTANSRPIAIVPEPDGGSMWFSEETGNNVARIDANGTITEFAVPKLQDNVILAGLAFDSDKNLWVQQYVDRNRPEPAGPDYIIKINKRVLTVAPSELTGSDFTFFEAPSRGTVMHRIIEGPDGDMWFTELKTDTVGKVSR